MRSVRLSRQTWLALAAAVTFVVLALLITVLPVPYVVYSPGRAYDVLAVDAQGEPALQVEGLPTYPPTGELHMTTVAVTRADARASLPEAVMAFWLPRRDALPRDSVYDPGKTSEEVRAEERQMMDTSQQDATVAALREADVPVEQVPVVAAVTVSGPANGRLQPGDLILSVDGETTPNPADVGNRVRATAVGESVRFTVEREREILDVDVTTTAGPSDPAVAWVGIDVGTGFRYEPRIDFGLTHDVGGPSAGLVFALAIYDQISPDDLLQGRSVAGTGEIDPTGRVRPIGGLQEKIASAERVDASVFLVPGDNCRDLAGLRTDMDLIRAETLQDAIRGLRALGDPARVGEIPRC